MDIAYSDPYTDRPGPDAEEDERRRQEEEARRRQEQAAAPAPPTHYTDQPPAPKTRGSSVAQAWTGGGRSDGQAGTEARNQQRLAEFRAWAQGRGLTVDQGDVGAFRQMGEYGWTPGLPIGAAAATTSAPAAATTDPRAEQFYQQLLQRSQQGLAIDRTNPVIRAQADAFAANQERARRNYVSDVAERQGPLANIEGERRIAAERVGQATGGFEAELLGRELTARRQEISEALTLMGGLLSRDQATALQRELAQLDAAIARENAQLQAATAREGFGVQRRAQDIGADEFLRELAQRQYEYGDTSDWRWAGL